MLNKQDVLNAAVNYLYSNEYPIVVESAVVNFPEDEQDPDSKKTLLKNSWAWVSFDSNFPENPDDPLKQLVPSTLIVYVNYNTGEVHMPRHMA